MDVRSNLVKLFASQQAASDGRLFEYGFWQGRENLNVRIRLRMFGYFPDHVLRYQPQRGAPSSENRTQPRRLSMPERAGTLALRDAELLPGRWRVSYEGKLFRSCGMCQF